MPIPLINGMTPEQIEARRQREEAERKSELETLRVEAEVLGIKYDPTWTLERLKVHVREFRRKQAVEEDIRRREAERQAALAKERAKLVKADQEAAARIQREDQEIEAWKMRVGRCKLWISEHLTREQIKELMPESKGYLKEYERYLDKRQDWLGDIREYNNKVAQGPNARCPYCGYTMRIPPARIGGSVCPKCSGHFPSSRAFAQFKAPPPPEEPAEPKLPYALTQKIYPSPFANLTTGLPR